MSKFNIISFLFQDTSLIACISVHLKIQVMVFGSQGIFSIFYFSKHLHFAPSNHLSCIYGINIITVSVPETDLEGGVRGVRPPHPKIRKAYAIQR